MWTVFCDDNILHDPALSDSTQILINGKVTKAVNTADSFSFTIYPNHKNISAIDRLTSVIKVYKDDNAIPFFYGRVLNDKKGWLNQRTIECESWFACFNDTVVRPYEYEGSVRAYLEMLVSQHNSQVPAEKRFTVRTVTVTDPNDYIVRANSTYPSTMQELQDKLVSNLGGYLIYEHNNGVNYIDYLEESTTGSSQKITLTSNLLDFSQEDKGEEIITALIPLGAKTEETGERLTIASVNDGLDYIVHNEAAARYGLIYGTATWDDVTVPENLLIKARAALNEICDGKRCITLTAADLSQVNADIGDFDFFEYVTVEDDVHNITGRYLVSKMTVLFDAPDKNRITIGTETQGLSQSTQHVLTDVLAAVSDVVTTAQVTSIAQQISEQITGGYGGYVRFHINSETGEPDEFLIMDQPDIATAVRVWRWNKNGLGYSSSGYGGPYKTAWAIRDGGLNADFITNGIIQGIEIIANMGSIGGWDINDKGLSKEVVDPNNVNNHYKVTIYTPDTENPRTSHVVDFMLSEDGGQTWTELFYIPGDGSMTIYSENSDGTERFQVVERTNRNNKTIVNSNGIHVNQVRQGSTATNSHLWSSSLEFKDSAGRTRSAVYGGSFSLYDAAQVLRAIMYPDTISFRDENGVETATYPGKGWQEITRTDTYAAGGQTTWRYLDNGPIRMACCRRRFTNVNVNYQWGNIYCGTGGGQGCNFPALAFPVQFDVTPVVLVSVETPQNGNDGWLVTNGRYSPSDPTWYTPAYDLARAVSGTVPEITLNYIVIGIKIGTVSVTQNLTGVSSNNPATTVWERSVYENVLTADAGKVIAEIKVTMDGRDITDEVYTPNGS